MPVTTQPATTQIESRIVVLSFYREAELHGSRLLLNLMNHLLDGETQTKLTRHVADETRHAWLLTRRIAELGGSPRDIGEAGYQRQLGRSVGLPRDVIDLLVLTLVAEERALERYTTQAEHPAVDAATREVFCAVSADERWHVAWVRERLFDLAYEPSYRRAADFSEDLTLQGGGGTSLPDALRSRGGLDISAPAARGGRMRITPDFHFLSELSVW